MKRALDVTPQARRDVVAILDWYRKNVGVKAALKVAQTLRTRLNSLATGRVRGAEVDGSHYMRAVAKKHVIIFLAAPDAIRIVRIVHGAQDLDAIVASLDEEEEAQ